MALVASNLKDAIVDGFEPLNQDFADGNLSNPPTAYTSKLSEIINEYVVDNASLTFSWTATNPGTGAPDPIVSTTGEFLTFTVSITPSGITDPSLAQSALATQMGTSVLTSTYNITATGFITTPAAIGTLSSPISFNINSTEPEQALLQLSTDIINWIKAFVLATPCAGTHGVYVGSGSVTAIS